MTKKGVGKKHAKAAPAAHSTSAKKPHKHVKIKHHHAKPYRKRHYGSLFLFLFASFLLALLIVQYNAQIQSSTDRARAYFEKVFSNQQAASQAVESTFGFSVQYDPSKFYATALDSATGKLFIGDELTTTRPYQTVRISPVWSSGTQPASSYLNIELLPQSTSLQTAEAVEANVIAKETKNTQGKLVKLDSQQVQIDGQPFIKSSWQREFSAPNIPSQIAPRLVTYSGVVNGNPYSIVATEQTDRYDAVIASLTFGPKVTVGAPKYLAETSATKTVFDSLLFSKIARAASEKETPSTEYVSSLYSPAIVRVYNVYCQDVLVDGKPFLKEVCDGGVGSGFFVSSDGYIATNGHVAGSSPQDSAIEYALAYLVRGDARYFGYLADLAGLEESDLAGAKSEKEAYGIAINRLYEIPADKFTTTNSVSNLLVTLGEQQPAVDELVDLTKKRKEYAEQDTIKRAEFIAMDFRKLDGVDGFKGSDVALLKVDGQNYPVTKLGALSDVSQGAALNILGFPAGANDNQLVSSTKSKVTLTSGKVSSIKDAEGNGNKLIETDTVIGHGNSGGPALNDKGSVVGIATYTVDGGGAGDGTFNYVRDINDFKELASKESITFDTKSKTQSEWQKGIDKFYNAHYSSAIKYFEKAKELYPAHPTAAALIDTSNEKIKAGEEVKEFPVLQVLGVFMILALGGAAVAVVVIVRHKKKHGIYQQGVAAGAVQPMTPGAPAQYVNPAVLPQQPQPYQPPVPSSFGPQPAQPQPVAPPAPQPQAPQAPEQQVPVQFAQPQIIAPSQPAQDEQPKP